MDDKSKQTEDTTDLKSKLLNKVLELQGSTLSIEEQINSLINFVQALLEIDSIAVYSNFAGKQINITSSHGPLEQHSKLGYLIELVAEGIDYKSSKYFNSLIPISELNIKNL